MKRTVKIWTGLALLLAVSGIVAWQLLLGTTHIAFINYQAITLGQIAKANDHSRIQLSALDGEELDDIGQYDAVLINGMGLRITEEQRTKIQQAADNGLTVITTMATNPANEIISADSVTVATIKGYLNGGGRRNYRNLLTYIRRQIEHEYLVARGESALQCADIIAVEYPFVSLYDVAEPHIEFFTRNRRLVRLVPDVVEMNERQTRCGGEFFGKYALACPGTPYHDNFFHSFSARYSAAASAATAPSAAAVTSCRTFLVRQSPATNIPSAATQSSPATT